MIRAINVFRPDARRGEKKKQVSSSSLIFLRGNREKKKKRKRMGGEMNLSGGKPRARWSTRDGVRAFFLLLERRNDVFDIIFIHRTNRQRCVVSSSSPQVLPPFSAHKISLFFISSSPLIESIVSIARMLPRAALPFSQINFGKRCQSIGIPQTRIFAIDAQKKNYICSPVTALRCIKKTGSAVGNRRNDSIAQRTPWSGRTVTDRII